MVTSFCQDCTDMATRMARAANLGTCAEIVPIFAVVHGQDWIDFFDVVLPQTQ